MTRPAKFKPFVLFLLALPCCAFALDVSLIGVFPGKGAVLVIDGSAPKSIKIGQKSPEGVSLVSVEKETAVIEIEGRKKTLKIGQHHRTDTSSARGSTFSVSANNRGQFIAAGMINDKNELRMLIDTGASAISIPEKDAQRMGLDYKAGAPGAVSTANGVIQVWRVKLASVKLGDVSVNNIDAVVIPGDGLPIALLGMNFLDRFEMNREGGTMTLRKRF